MGHRKPRLLFAGASGYSNTGDNAYPIVFEKYLSDDFDLIFDSPYPTLEKVDISDGVVIGGGGAIFDHPGAHFKYMSSYLDRAIEQDKPFFFLSCGVQLVKDNVENAVELNITDKTQKDRIIEIALRQIQRWRPYLERAELITVRSQTDKAIIEALCDSSLNIHYCPDAIYLLEPAEYQLIEPNSTVFIITEAIESISVGLTSTAASPATSFVAEILEVNTGVPK